MSVDQSNGTSLLLRQVATDEQMERSRDVGSYGIPQVVAYVGDFGAGAGKTLVFCNPEQGSDFYTLLPGTTPLTVEQVLKIGESLIVCINGLALRGYSLTMLFAEDIIVSRVTGKAYLINLDNVEPITGVPSNRAKADLARMLLQLSLNCSYEVASHCVRRGKKGRYRLHRLPEGLDSRVGQFIERLVPPSIPRIIKRSIPYAMAASGVVAALSAVVLWPVPTALEGTTTAPIVKEATKTANKRFRRHACSTAIRENTPGDCKNVNLTGEDFSGKDFRGIVLKGLILRDVDLTGADFSGMTLERVNFDGADLRNANFVGITARDVTWGTANLDGATLVDSDLTHADFSSAYLGAVDLDGADISHADLSGVNLSNQTLSGVTATETNFDGAFLHGVKLEGGSYIRARFYGTDMGSAVLSGNVFFDEATFHNVDLAGARFSNAVLYSTGIYNSSLNEAVFDHAELSGTSFIASNLDDITIYHSSLYGGSFQGSSLTNATISGSLVQAMDFADSEARGLQIQDSDLSRSSNIPSYLFFGVRYRNVVMPNGEVRP
ncbi:pentapeptide repeat protein [Leptolyngbya sp. Heron Island J]|uniref:pentapeptide repeat-containing protein n=1 Tax=Leptolyngbya sp. Heron Island J TaxID=1385935 RepID=UPI0003B9B629|nr:pentapeptide repeat-containing protein [Leptolyngbya sp. Heron Island J]ESA36546.1 pentapeptide repeat protein [Leptolyngbya sp. Heron Island J]